MATAKFTRLFLVIVATCCALLFGAVLSTVSHDIYEYDDDTDRDTLDLNDPNSMLPAHFWTTTPPNSQQALINPCPVGEVPCLRSEPLKCIPRLFLCDNDPDCPNGEDEANCQSPVSFLQPLSTDCDPKTHRRCNPALASSRCLLTGFWCDGDEDCPLGEDETNCTVPTPASDQPTTPATVSATSLTVQLEPQTLITVAKGSSFLLTCKINGPGFSKVEWVNIDHGLIVSADGLVLVSDDSSKYRVKWPGVARTPSTVNNLNYSLNVTNASYYDTGVYACRVSQTLNDVNSTISKYIHVYMPGAPINQHRRVDFDEEPAMKINRPKNNEVCCRTQNVSSSCLEPLCVSQNMASWEMPSVGSCMRHAAGGLLCLSAGHSSLSCCILNGVKPECQRLCQQGLSAGDNADYLLQVLDCYQDWPKLVSCFSESNANAIDPPVGVTAKAINSSAIALTWLPPVEVSGHRGIRYAVFKGDVQPTDPDPTDNTFTQLTVTSETNYVVKKLTPLRRYAFYVVAVATSGRSSARSFIVEAVTYPQETGAVKERDNLDIGACCQRLNVPTDCAAIYCTLNHTAPDIQSSVSHGLDCSSSMKPMLSCLAGSYNHTDCCLLRHVPRNCTKFCVGKSDPSKVVTRNDLLPSDIECLPHIGMMASCFLENRGRLPNPPQALSVSIGSLNPSRLSAFSFGPSVSATLSWLPPQPVRSSQPDRNTEVRRYRISLTSPGAGSVQDYHVSSSQTRYTFSHPFANIGYDGMYVVSIAAENAYGWSIEVSSSFSTPDQSSLQNGETYDPAIRSSMRVCCDNEKVPTNCMASCTPVGIRSLDAYTGRYSRQNPHLACINQHWRKYAFCASIQTDVTNCCLSRRVALQCIDICNMTDPAAMTDMFKARTAFCNAYTSDVFHCVAAQWNSPKIKTIISKPLPPTGLSLATMSLMGNWAVVSWRAPRGGASFVDYIVALRQNGSDSEMEAQVPAKLSSMRFNNLVPKTTYWVRMYSVTHQGIRSDPSAIIAVTTPLGAFTTANRSAIDSIETCCAQTSQNCRSICTSLTAYHDASNNQLLTSCAKDLVAITRCSLLSLRSVAADLNQPLKANISQCCLDNKLDTGKLPCCQPAFTTEELSAPFDSCNAPATLQAVRTCVWQGLTALGPSQVRAVTVNNVTSSTANLSWLPPLYNAASIVKYDVQCQIFQTNGTEQWEDEAELVDFISDDELIAVGAIGNSTIKDETSVVIGPLRPGSYLSCIVYALTAADLSAGKNSQTASPVVEFLTKSEDYDIELALIDETSVGGYAEFNCQTKGIAFDSIRWFFTRFGSKQSTEIQNPGHIYKIPGLTSDHSGTYSCDVHSTYANRTFRGSVPLFVRDVPKSFYPDQEIECGNGCPSLTTRNCSFTGFPDAVAWYWIPTTTSNSTRANVPLSFSDAFERNGALSIAFVTSFALSLLNEPRTIALEARATNIKGDGTCRITIKRDSRAISARKPGWRYTPQLCQIVSMEFCCSIVEPSCTRLCSFAQRCADFVPNECLSGFQRCQRSHLVPPDITEKMFNLTLSSVESYFNESVKTRVSFTWLSGKKPSYQFDLFTYLVIESDYDPHDHRIVDISRDGQTFYVDLEVPNAPYNVTIFAENELGDRSVTNFTKTVTTLSPGMKAMPTMNAARQHPTRQSPHYYLHVLWLWPWCELLVANVACTHGFIFFRPVIIQGSTIVRLGDFSGIGTRDHVMLIFDQNPSADYILLVCVGETSRECIYSEPYYLPAGGQSVTALRLVGATASSISTGAASSSSSSSTVIGLSIVFALGIVVLVVLIGYFFGRRIVTAISSRLRSNFVMYQRAPPGETDGNAIIFEDFAANNNNIEIE